jgi:arginine repressor
MGVDDLVIDEGDLRELGISASESECERILYSLADIVIVKPEKNKREILLKEAERIKKNPLMILINKVNWIK